MIRNPLPVIITAMIITLPNATGEVIGDFKVIAAPTAAAQTGGGALTNSWLNVVPAAVTVSEAFTEFSLIDNGFQVNSGTSFDLDFEPGVVQNRAGPDLVLFDADPGLNVYLVTVYYQEAPIIRVISATTDTQVTREYYTSTGGPTQHSVLAAAIDLTMFAIPDGGDVAHVRIFSEGPDCGPLGVGALLSTCPQDVNGDGAIDLADLSQLLSSFGSGYGDDSFTPHADLDADGSIGLSDLAELLSQFGESC